MPDRHFCEDVYQANTCVSVKFYEGVKSWDTDMGTVGFKNM